VIDLRANLKIVIATRLVDFRKGVRGLSALVAEALAADPFLCLGWDYVADAA
jgi:transposase